MRQIKSKHDKLKLINDIEIKAPPGMYMVVALIDCNTYQIDDPKLTLEEAKQILNNFREQFNHPINIFDARGCMVVF